MYIIVKYCDITRTLYLTIDSQLVGGQFFDHGVHACVMYVLVDANIQNPCCNFVALALTLITPSFVKIRNTTKMRWRIMYAFNS